MPDFKRNLLSLGMLDQAGCSFKGEGGVLKTCKGSMVIMKGIRKNGLYRLQGNTFLVLIWSSVYFKNKFYIAMAS